MDLLHTSWYYNSPEIFRAFANDFAKIKSRPRDEGELVVVGVNDAVKLKSRRAKLCFSLLIHSARSDLKQYIVALGHSYSSGCCKQQQSRGWPSIHTGSHFKLDIYYVSY